MWKELQKSAGLTARSHPQGGQNPAEDVRSWWGERGPGHGVQENLEASLTSSQRASLFIQNLVSRDTFTLFQNIGHIIFVFGPVFHFLLLTF